MPEFANFSSSWNATGLATNRWIFPGEPPVCLEDFRGKSSAVLETCKAAPLQALGLIEICWAFPGAAC